MLCGRRLPHIFWLISKKKNCNASLLFTSLLMSLSFSFCTTSKLSRCHIYIYTCPINFFELLTLPFEVFTHVHYKGDYFSVFDLPLSDFFYFEGHIIFYSFCFALTCEMSLILNSPSYFCVWLNTYAKRVEFSFYIRLLRRSIECCRKRKRILQRNFACKVSFNLTGKICPGTLASSILH